MKNNSEVIPAYYQYVTVSRPEIKAVVSSDEKVLTAEQAIKDFLIDTTSIFRKMNSDLESRYPELYG